MSSTVTPASVGALRRRCRAARRCRRAAAAGRGAAAITALELLGADDRVRRGGRGDHDVGALELAGQRVERARRAAEALGRARSRARARRLATNIVRDALVVQRLRGQLGGLAGADDHDVALARGRRARRAASVDGDRGDRGAAGARSPSRCARACRSASAARKSLFVSGPVGAGGERELVGALDLALDLGLADDHRLQAGCDAVQVARGVAVARRVHDARRARSGRIAARRASSPSTCDLGLDGVGDDEVELGAVAGGDRDGLGDARRGRSARWISASAPPSGSASRSRSATRRGLVRDAEREQLAHRGTASRSARARASRRSASSRQLGDLALDPRELARP